MDGLLTGVDYCFVYNFVQNAKLRVHAIGLFRVNTEETGIELCQITQFTASLRQPVQTCM